MATKTHNYNTDLAYSAAGSVYTSLTDVRDITSPTGERPRTDVTHLKSTGFTREFINSWIEPGEASFTLFFAKSMYSTLKTMQTDGTNYYWKLTFPLIDTEATGSTLIWRGMVKNVSIPTISVGDDAIMVDVTISTTGNATFTSGS